MTKRQNYNHKMLKRINLINISANNCLNRHRPIDSLAKPRTLLHSTEIGALSLLSLFSIQHRSSNYQRLNYTQDQGDSRVTQLY